MGTRDIDEQINEFRENPFADRIDPAGSNRRTYDYTIIREGAAEKFRKNSLKGTKVFQGIVLHVEKDSPIVRRRTNQSQTSAANKEYVAIRVRIPELHAHILKPKTIPIDKTKPGARGIIQQHPLFIATVGPKTPEPAEGSIVKVSFGQGPEAGQYDGVYLELYEGPAAFENNDPTKPTDPSTRLAFSQGGAPLPNFGDEGQNNLSPEEYARQTLEARRVNPPPPDRAFSSLPFEEPKRVTDEFGIQRTRGAHTGMDFSVPTGTPVFAVMDSPAPRTRAVNRTDQEIQRLLNSSNPDDRSNGAAGRFVELNDGNGFRVRYLHLDTIIVTEGQAISGGQQIGTTGNSGRSSGPHLHLDVTLPSGQRVNPRFYLRNDTFLDNQRTLSDAGTLAVRGRDE